MEINENLKQKNYKNLSKNAYTTGKKKNLKNK